MKVTKCITCTHYDNYYGTCKLWTDAIPLTNGEYEFISIPIKDIKEEYCRFEPWNKRS